MDRHRTAAAAAAGEKEPPPKVGMNPRPLAVSTHQLRVSAAPTIPGSRKISGDVSRLTALSFLQGLIVASRIWAFVSLNPTPNELYWSLARGFRGNR